MQRIGIGYENYKRMIDDRCYYIDKTMLISDVIEKGGDGYSLYKTQALWKNPCPFNTPNIF